MMMCKNSKPAYIMKFQPDYVPAKKILVEVFLSVLFFVCLFLVYDVVFPASPENGSEDAVAPDYLLNTILGFLAVFLVFAVINSAVCNHNYKNLMFGISSDGISVIFRDENIWIIPWENVQEIFVTHGPCEFDWPPEIDFLDGPYGLYVALQENCQVQLDALKPYILNLNFTSQQITDISNFKIIRLYKSERKKKCDAIMQQLLTLKNEKKW